MNPVVTVLMPVFNGERHIETAIQSVLNQTFVDFEILVVNDGSTDDTRKILAAISDARTRVVDNGRNVGLVESLNRGLAEAKGEWIARLDADDLMVPDRLSRQLEFLRGNPGVAILGSDARLINDSGLWCGRWRTAAGADWIRWDCGFRTPFAHSSVMFRGSLIRNRFGGYQDHHACEDLDLWGRVAAEFPVCSLSRCLTAYRIHAGSVMGIENASADMRRADAEYQILIRNQRSLAPGCDLAHLERIAAIWSGTEFPGATTDWAGYFVSLNELRLGYLRGRTAPRAFSKLVADQNYMLACRMDAGGRRAFLAALRRSDPSAFLGLPWARLGWKVLFG